MWTTAARDDGWWGGETAMSVDDLVSQLADAIADVDGGNPLVVSGEMAQWTRARSGHCYGSLRGSRAQLRIVMYRRQAAQLPEMPTPGQEVVLRGRPALYRERGEVEFVAQELRRTDATGPSGAARARLVSQLASEGALLPQRRRPLPAWPETIGIVTSPGSAAHQDFMDGLARCAPWVTVVLAPSRMEGPDATAGIVAALRVLQQDPAVEVALVARGGGDASALEAYDQEAVARAILGAQIPVITAIGHASNNSVADLVADFSAATPSAAVHHVTPGRIEAEARVAAFHERLGRVPERLRRTVADCRSRRAFLRTHLTGRVVAAAGRIRVCSLHLERRLASDVLPGHARTVAALRSQIRFGLAECLSAARTSLVDHRSIRGAMAHRVGSLDQQRCRVGVLLDRGVRTAVARWHLHLVRHRRDRTDIHLLEAQTRQRQHLEELRHGLPHLLLHRVAVAWQELDRRRRTKDAQVAGMILRVRRALTTRADLVRALSPVRVLERGYAVVLNASRAVRGAEELRPGDVVTIRLARGQVAARIAQGDS